MRVAFSNVWCANPNLAKTIAGLHKIGADVLALAEVPPKQVDSLLRAFPDFSHVHTGATNAMGSLLLLSKHPLTDQETVNEGACSNRPFIRVSLASTVPCTVFVAHTTAPFSLQRRRHRDDQIRSIADRARSASSPVIILGDLNADRKSAAVKDLLRDSTLRDARTGIPRTNTWPSFLPIWAIDHIIHSHTLDLRSFATHLIPWTDHRAVSADFT
jgi:endonuclease/exonuclease/phosphatase (EEP) superfamily protein YafD